MHPLLNLKAPPDTVIAKEIFCKSGWETKIFCIPWLVMPVDVKFTSRSFLHFGLPLSPHNPSTPVSVTREHDSILSTLSSGQDEPSKFNTSSVQAMHPLRSMTWRNGRFTGSFCNAFVLRREQFLRESCANFWKIDYTLSHGKKWKPKMQGHFRVSVFKGWVMGKLTGCEYNFTGLV